MNAIKNIIERASKLNGTVVLPEGQDPRVITAACACVERKLATPVVLGTAEEIAAAEAKAGKKLADFGIAVDAKANKVRGEVKVISKKGSKIPVVVLPTNEELMIARDTVRVLA